MKGLLMNSDFINETDLTTEKILGEISSSFQPGAHIHGLDLPPILQFEEAGVSFLFVNEELRVMVINTLGLIKSQRASWALKPETVWYFVDLLASHDPAFFMDHLAHSHPQLLQQLASLAAEKVAQ
jgi:hypothetical protein